jgi:hypothetical protein
METMNKLHTVRKRAMMLTMQKADEQLVRRYAD